MIEIYGMEGCRKCSEIVALAESSNIEFSYTKDKNTVISLAKKLQESGELLEQIAPLILKNKKQITHSEFEKLL